MGHASLCVCVSVFSLPLLVVVVVTGFLSVSPSVFMF